MLSNKPLKQPGQSAGQALLRRSHGQRVGPGLALGVNGSLVVETRYALGHAPGRGLFDFPGQDGGIQNLARRTAGEQLRQGLWAGEAAGVGGEDAVRCFHQRRLAVK